MFSTGNKTALTFTSQSIQVLVQVSTTVTSAFWLYLTAGVENAIHPEVISPWTYDCVDHEVPFCKPGCF